MANQKNFAITPSVSISRSKFRRPSQHKTSFNLGKLVPIYVDADILPGDTVSIDLAALVRMSTPIAPIMDNIYIDYYAFFVPNRLVWTGWKAFMGENTSTSGAVTEPTFPTIEIGSSNKPQVGSLGDYMGLPTVTGTGNLGVSALPGRSYLLIYNEWFRDQNLIAPLYVETGNVQLRLGQNNGSNLFYNMSLLTAAKESDYFTRALPYAQKGSPVTLPLGSTAPVYLAGSNLIAGAVTLSTDATSIGVQNLHQLTAANAGDSFGTLRVDLSNATASTINQLRFAFQYQKFLEKDALYGTRYWEILKGHFGITAPDASLQRPELLGHFRQHINVDQVLQTSESGTTALGTPGANSVSGKSEHLISKSFVEHGTLMILAVARHDQTYGQGINRMWSRKTRTDFYFPVFANLGAQEIKNKEIYAVGGSSDEQVFGFQEAWAEYRYKPVTMDGL